MSSHLQDGAALGPAADLGGREDRSGRSIFARYAARRPGLLAASLTIGLVVGIVYRLAMDPAAERDLANYFRSGLQGVGMGLALWAVRTGFAATTGSAFGRALRRVPLAGEVLIRSLAMTAALVVVGVALQFVLYAGPYGLRWFTADWFATTLPLIVATGFAVSLVVHAIIETGRLIGGPMLASVVLGTYHRPVREQRIVMFLDIAGSTRLAEQLGELRVHDLITRFFFDIDEPIGDHGGRVHAYVGDEVIVTWPLAADPARNARCLACFFAIERKMARLAADYRREFGVVPRFRAGLHAGPVIVSECGDAKRQLAYFGDTMNVAARLCERCKVADQRLVVSGDLLRRVTIPAELRVGVGESIALRGRQEPIEVNAIRQHAMAGETPNDGPADFDLASPSPAGD
ncbi:MAG TPA: adenylate/guanylate cyclase domain-containing protein [Stellaceae bacterium]|jgi:class 3 adenylate cyclase